MGWWGGFLPVRFVLFTSKQSFRLINREVTIKIQNKEQRSPYSRWKFKQFSSDFSVFIFSLESSSAFFTQALKSARVKGVFISWKLSLRLGSLIGMCEVLEGKLLTSCVSEV